MASSSSHTIRSRRTPPSIAWATVAASVPLMVWARDSLVGLCRVQGSSMQPCLQDGDVVFVRKCDRGALTETLVNIVTGGGSGGGGGSSHNSKNDETERARVTRYELLQGITTHAGPQSQLYECPPLALPGQVVVYKNPSTAFPNELCVKRVAGVGGQYVSTTTGASSSRRRSRYHQVQTMVPPYYLFVEGDNAANSQDSRQVGPISKGLLVGIAEYVVWPPTRWGRIRRHPVRDENGSPRAVWP